jgi:hypothetical protein
VSQFDRIASVSIGPPGQQGFRVRDVRIVFQVDKTDLPDANRCRLEIWNLSDDTRNRIRETDDAVVVSAGYAQDTGEQVLFTGRVASVAHRYVSPDIVTRIESGDGITELRESRSAVSFSGPGASLPEIVRKLADDFGLEIRDSIDVPRIRWTEGLSYAGPTRNAMTSVLDRAGFEWSVQNGYLQIIRRGDANTKPAVVIRSDTGLLSSPARINQIETALEGTKRNPGWAFRCLLNPRIEPGGLVQLNSRDVDGLFRVNNVRHSGDMHGDEWSSLVEVSEL